MEIPTGNEAPADITSWFDSTGLTPLMQLAFDVNKHFTTSPFAGVVVKAGFPEGRPELTPLICHWNNGDAPPFRGFAV